MLPLTPSHDSPSSRIRHESAKLVVIGAAAVDVIAKAAGSSPTESALVTQSTVPGSVQTSLGGVARNMAEAAHRSLISLNKSKSGSNASRAATDSRTLLVAPVGDDSFGSLIRRETEAIGMRSDGFLSNIGDEAKTSGVERRSPVCNMFLSPTGDLLGGVADFSALDTLRSAEVSTISKSHRSFSELVCYLR